jgi:hypothetical protein
MLYFKQPEKKKVKPFARVYESEVFISKVFPSLAFEDESAS